MKEIIAFLLGRVIGKMLYTDELVYDLDGGTLKGVYSDRMSFCNLLCFDLGFSVDLFVVADEKIYHAGEDGALGGLCHDFSSVSLFRYEFAKRQSSSELTGYSRFISGTSQKGTARAVVSSLGGVCFTGEELSWQENQALYRDQPTGGESFRPVAFEAQNRFYFEEGKLRFAYDGRCYDVDICTLERTYSADTLPQFIAKEK
ncbi:hypothetical protein LJC56_09655 [Christensenellaceae bacterium OttesenSCG-928-K19]|nr:hypothetical protein [Christensenellaceae bacterium OttesenSCG-928-K19]